MLGAPPRGRSHRKIAIHPLSFAVRPQSIILWLDQSGEPHEASSQNFLALHTFSSSAAVANMQVCCVASRCAARRRGPLRPFLRSAQWRSLHLMCRLPALHRCPTPSRSSRGDLLAQLSAGAVRWRCAPSPRRLLRSAASIRCHQLAVISSQSLPRRPKNYDIMSLGRTVRRLAVTSARYSGSLSPVAGISSQSSRSHRLTVIGSQSSARSRQLAVHQLAVIRSQSVGSQSSARHTGSLSPSQGSARSHLAVIGSQSSALSHSLAVLRLAVIHSHSDQVVIRLAVIRLQSLAAASSAASRSPSPRVVAWHNGVRCAVLVP